MKKNIYYIVFVLFAVLTLARCSDPVIDVYEPIDLSSQDAAATYFDYGGYTHFVLSFTSGSDAVSVHLVSDELSTSAEKIVQVGEYSYSGSLGSDVLTSLSTVDGQSVSSGDLSVSKDFLTYTLSGSLNGTSVDYTGYILTVTPVGIAMTVNNAVEESGVLKLCNNDGDTLSVPYTDSYVGTIALGSDSYYKAADGTVKEIDEGSLVISESDGVFTVQGSVLTTDPVPVTVKGKWSTAAIVSGSISFAGTDQSAYNNTFWTVNVTDNSGFEMAISIITDLSVPFYSAAGTTINVASTWANNTIVAGYDWGSWGSGGTSYTVGGVKNLITSGALTFTSSDGATITIEGTISDGTNSYEISGAYTAPASFNYLATSDWTAYGGTYGMLFGTNDVTATYNWSTWSYDYTGNGNLLSVEFKQAVTPGTYTALANSDAAFDPAANFIIGYYNSTYYSYSGAMYGEMVDGSIAFTNDNIVTAGTITVTEDSGTYTFTFDLELATGDKVVGSCETTL